MIPKIAVMRGDPYGSGYYRCRVPYEELNRIGKCEATLVGEYENPALRKCDIGVFQLQCLPDQLKAFNFYKNHFKFPSIYEFDDDVRACHPTNPAYKRCDYRPGTEIYRTFEEFVRLADVCTVTTPALADAYRHLNSRIVVCPNVIADSEVDRVAPSIITGALKRPGQVRIGYGSSCSHDVDILTIVKPISKILRERPWVRIVFVGGDYRRHFSPRFHHQLEYGGKTWTPFSLVVLAGSPELQIERDGKTLVRDSSPTPWSPPLYLDLMKSLDIDLQIAPLARIPFNASKSCLKVLEAAVLGTPIVAFGGYEYLRYAKAAPRGEPILLATDDRSWKRQVDRLLDSQELRRQVATENLAYVRESHVISKAASCWAEVIDELVSSKLGHGKLSAAHVDGKPNSYAANPVLAKHRGRLRKARDCRSIRTRRARTGADGALRESDSEFTVRPVREAVP